MARYLGRDGRIYDHDPGEGICLDDLSLFGQPRPQAAQPRPQAAQPAPHRTRPRATLPVHTVSWQRKFWYWFLTLGGAALLSAGVYFMFQDTLFTMVEAENLTGLLRNLMSTISPFALVAGGVIPTLCYGISAADLNNYNLHAYLWAGITCIFSLTLTVFLLIVLPPVAAVVITVVIVWNILKFIWEMLTG